MTTTRNELVRPIHPDRIPVILDPADWEQWMEGTTEEAAELLRLYPVEAMRIVLKGQHERADPGGASAAANP